MKPENSTVFDKNLNVASLLDQIRTILENENRGQILPQLKEFILEAFIQFQRRLCEGTFLKETQLEKEKALDTIFRTFNDLFNILYVYKYRQFLKQYEILLQKKQVIEKFNFFDENSFCEGQFAQEIQALRQLLVSKNASQGSCLLTLYINFLKNYDHFIQLDRAQNKLRKNLSAFEIPESMLLSFFSANSVVKKKTLSANTIDDSDEMLQRFKENIDDTYILLLQEKFTQKQKPLSVEQVSQKILITFLDLFLLKMKNIANADTPLPQTTIEMSTFYTLLYCFPSFTLLPYLTEVVYENYKQTLVKEMLLQVGTPVIEKVFDLLSRLLPVLFEELLGDLHKLPIQEPIASTYFKNMRFLLKQKLQQASGIISVWDSQAEAFTFFLGTLVMLAVFRLLSKKLDSYVDQTFVLLEEILSFIFSYQESNFLYGLKVIFKIDNFKNKEGESQGFSQLIKQEKDRLKKMSQSEIEKLLNKSVDFQGSELSQLRDCIQLAISTKPTVDTKKSAQFKKDFLQGQNFKTFKAVVAKPKPNESDKENAAANGWQLLQENGPATIINVSKEFGL